jgi:acetolactate decarboxylase
MTLYGGKKMKRTGWIGLLLFIAVLGGAWRLTPGNAAPEDRDRIYQVSTLSALMEGIYEGAVSFGELKQYGDIGIGTFNGLDGEMIEIDGVFYQIRADGKAYRVADMVKTPFAVVTFYEPDQTLSLGKVTSLTELCKSLDRKIPTPNVFYAIRIDGEFSFVKTRSVPGQQRPYPRLADVVKNQPVFELTFVKGIIVGFRCPPYVGGVNLPGYHFHFITADRKAGGHLLDCRIIRAEVGIDFTHEFEMILGTDRDFYRVDLRENKEEEVRKVER